MKDYKKLSRMHFNEQASEYDTNSTYYYSGPAKVSCHDVAEHLKYVDYTSLLDVGCGTGYLLSLLAKQKQADYHGLDLAEGMVAVAQGKGIPATFVQGSADKLPYRDGQFDIVTCIQSFHHYPYPDQAMQEVLRVLKPNGIYILSDTGVGGIAGWLDNKIIFPLLKSGDYQTENKNGIARRMERNGFGVIQKKQVKGFIYTVIGQKASEADQL